MGVEWTKAQLELPTDISIMELAIFELCLTWFVLSFLVRQVMGSFIWCFWPIDIDLSAGRTGEQSIHSVFVDSGGSHCIATVVGTGGADTFYIHAKWSKPRLLTRMKGLVVNAVAWNRQQITEGNFFLSILDYLKDERVGIGPV